jgi:inner membrane protein
MPTILSHPAVSIATAMIGGRQKVSWRLFGIACVASILPDADVIGYYLGIPYGHLLGHRGFSHSISFALLVALLGVALAGRLHSGRLAAFMVLFVSTVSHGVLDALTSGGLGIAFLSPFSNERYFFPWRPIKVSHMSLEPFLGRSGWRVMPSEFAWVWLPSLLLGSCGLLCRRIFGWLTIGYAEQTRRRSCLSAFVSSSFVCLSSFVRRKQRGQA